MSLSSLKMRITGKARWTSRVNMVEIRCSCGARFEHRADRSYVRCPNCSRRDFLWDMRTRYYKEKLTERWLKKWRDKRGKS